MKKKKNLVKKYIKSALNDVTRDKTERAEWHAVIVASSWKCGCYLSGE